MNVPGWRTAACKTYDKKCQRYFRKERDEFLNYTRDWIKEEMRRRYVRVIGKGMAKKLGVDKSGR